MAKETWAPRRKAGESHDDYKKRYYRAQREHAEETGDQGTTDKINKKLGRKSHIVDADMVNKGALQGVATVAGARLPGASAAGKLALTGAKRGAQMLEGPVATGLRTAEGALRRVGSQGAKAALKGGERRALPVGQRALPSRAGGAAKVAERAPTKAARLPKREAAKKPVVRSRKKRAA